MNTIVIIPARYASTRYPGKPLVELKGSDGITTTLIQRTWETACAVSGVSGIFIATDDQRIAARLQDFGAKVIITSESCANGTARCAAARPAMHRTPNHMLTLPGDTPLTHHT